MTEKELRKEFDLYIEGVCKEEECSDDLERDRFVLMVNDYGAHSAIFFHLWKDCYNKYKP